MREGLQVVQKKFTILREWFRLVRVVQGRPGCPGAGKWRILREGFGVVQKKSLICETGFNQGRPDLPGARKYQILRERLEVVQKSLRFCNRGFKWRKCGQGSQPPQELESPEFCAKIFKWCRRFPILREGLQVAQAVQGQQGLLGGRK